MDQNGRASKSGTLVLGGLEVGSQVISDIESNEASSSRRSTINIVGVGQSNAAPHLQQSTSDPTHRQMNPQKPPAEIQGSSEGNSSREEVGYSASRSHSHQTNNPTAQQQQSASQQQPSPQFGVPITSIPSGSQGVNCNNPACMNLQIAFQKQAAVIEELKGALLQFGLYCQTAAHNVSNLSHLTRQQVYLPGSHLPGPPNAQTINQQQQQAAISGRMTQQQMMGMGQGYPSQQQQQQHQQRVFANVEPYNQMGSNWVQTGPYSMPDMKRRMVNHGMHQNESRHMKEIKFVETAMAGAIGKNGIYWQPDKGRWFIEWDDGEEVPKRIFFPSSDPNQSSEMVLQDAVRQRQDIIKKLMDERNIILTPASPTFEEIQQHITDFAHRIAHNTDYDTNARNNDNEGRISRDDGANDTSKYQFVSSPSMRAGLSSSSTPRGTLMMSDRR